MKFATKKTAVKKAPAKEAAPAALTAAREALTASPTSVRDAAVAALVHISPGLVEVTPQGVTPLGLFELSFNDPKVGVDDSQMPAFFAAVSTAINDARVDALIQAKLAGTGSSANIGDVVRLIQLWVNNPDIKA